MSEGTPAEALAALRLALEEQSAWLVGGVPRDRALRRLASAASDVACRASTTDVDVVVAGSARDAARAVARAAPGGAACFELSADFSGWRVVARDHSWQADIQPLRGGSLEADLALRDFTVNAIAEPLAGGDPVDPLGGLADVAARRLRMAGPRAFSDDPLRALRLVRIALELDLEIDRETARAASAAASDLTRISGERIFAELRRVIGFPRVVDGLERMGELGITAAILPELEQLRGVEQNRYHHLDVYGHTLEVLRRVVALEAGPAAALGADEQDEPLRKLLAEPLADELTRGEALRFGALLHDIAKPLTRGIGASGTVTFFGHDVRGAELSRAILGRLRTSERLRTHVAALVRNHLRLGFLVHEPQPLARRTVHAYLCETSPVEVDVTLLSVADRLATRGARARESIDAHLGVARAMLDDALRWRADGPPRALWQGDRLAAELGIATGPLVGELLAEIAAAQYAGEVTTREQALAHARAHLRRSGGGSQPSDPSKR